MKTGLTYIEMSKLEIKKGEDLAKRRENWKNCDEKFLKEKARREN